MPNFVKIADEAITCDFLNLDLVTKVQCSVKRIGGGIDVKSIGDGSGTVSSHKSKLAIITLLTANGSGEIRFTDFSEAETWLREFLGISVSFAQL